MELFKVMVPLDVDLLTPSMDAFEHDGRIWIVLWWNVLPGTGLRFPVRTIPLDSLPHVPNASRIGLARGVRFLVTHSVARELLDPVVPPEVAAAYEIVDQSTLAFDTPDNR